MKIPILNIYCWADFLFCLTLTIFFGLGVFGFGLVICDRLLVTKECADADVIESVGGCDRGGNCGVKLKSGRFLRRPYPVPGEPVCLLERWKKESGE